MLGISFYELFIILVVIVIIFKPKDIGCYLYNLGKIIKKAKNFIFNIQTQIEDITTLGDIKDYQIKEKPTFSNSKKKSDRSKISDSNSSNN